MIHIVPPDTNIIDGAAMHVEPGDSLVLKRGYSYSKPLRFLNIIGTKEKPVIITTDGLVTLQFPINLSYCMKFEGCSFFRLTCDEYQKHLGMIGANITLSLDKLTTEFEIDHIEVAGSGFAGIMAKTDPTFPEAMRDKFTMRNVRIHHCHVHHTGHLVLEIT